MLINIKFAKLLRNSTCVLFYFSQHLLSYLNISLHFASRNAFALNPQAFVELVIAQIGVDSIKDTYIYGTMLTSRIILAGAESRFP